MAGGIRNTILILLNERGMDGLSGTNCGRFRTFLLKMDKAGVSGRPSILVIGTGDPRSFDVMLSLPEGPSQISAVQIVIGRETPLCGSRVLKS